MIIYEDGICSNTLYLIFLVTLVEPLTQDSSDGFDVNNAPAKVETSFYWEFQKCTSPSFYLSFWHHFWG